MSTCAHHWSYIEIEAHQGELTEKEMCALMRDIANFQHKLLTKYGLRPRLQITTREDAQNIAREIAKVFLKYGVSDADGDHVVDLLESLYSVPRDQRLIESEAV